MYAPSSLFDEVQTEAQVVTRDNNTWSLCRGDGAFVVIEESVYCDSQSRFVSGVQSWTDAPCR